MLTTAQIGYLNTVPEGKITHIEPFNPGTQKAAKEIIAEVMSDVPSATAHYVGSSKLGIAGENDIDLTILAGSDFMLAASSLEKRYGVPHHRSTKRDYMMWEFERNGFPVELHLTDFVDAGLQEQLDTQKILENDTSLCAEYEAIKRTCNGLPWKEYLVKKYEFWNRILGITD